MGSLPRPYLTVTFQYRYIPTAFRTADNGLLLHKRTCSRLAWVAVQGEPCDLQKVGIANGSKEGKGRDALWERGRDAGCCVCSCDDVAVNTQTFSIIKHQVNTHKTQTIMPWDQQVFSHTCKNVWVQYHLSPPDGCPDTIFLSSVRRVPLWHYGLLWLIQW